MAPKRLTAVTWNIAAINNNPFEYWLGKHPDPMYERLMSGVEQFISAPGEKDVAVSSIFSEAMWCELKQVMLTQSWAGIEGTEQRWRSDFSRRRIISEFLCDRSIGDKRLTSLPDRVTNSISVAAGGVVNRPTVVSNFSGEMKNLSSWWAAWKRFMFEEPVQVKEGKKLPCELLFKINRAKYPEVTEEEEAISIPLQLLALAIFDAILLHVVDSVMPGGAWQELKLGIVSALLATKRERTAEILATQYADADVCFVQEADLAFITFAEARFKGKYTVLRPHVLSKAQQNSLILLRNDVFDASSVVDCSADAMSTLGDQPVSDGDLLAVRVDGVDGTKYFLASFHGDTNGLASPKVLEALHLLCASTPGRTPLWGMDANTHKVGSKKAQGFDEFVALFTQLGYASCWATSATGATNHTTFNARTYLQAQLQKAVRSADVHSASSSAAVDKNPKDFVLFDCAAFSIEETLKDNTGCREFIDNICFPTLDFPSDHAVVKTVLLPRGSQAHGQQTQS
eukprot:CAMPEP_0119373422 /NCGR_PEP_ID=MMETSP1334-20130426/25636_1 /TAXON_ID=127549 /ORGANISM="Calcidiscus leptoporus, Strain RCC1130" /LENGTH=512 /DNA_ID=CAMNT_0007391203 /DNA_START=49 /DNA_END=1587 /DNA_ORIENTATION=+